jgi:hypothetical protein
MAVAQWLGVTFDCSDDNVVWREDGAIWRPVIELRDRTLHPLDDVRPEVVRDQLASFLREQLPTLRIVSPRGATARLLSSVDAVTRVLAEGLLAVTRDPDHSAMVASQFRSHVVALIGDPGRPVPAWSSGMTGEDLRAGLHTARRMCDFRYELTEERRSCLDCPGLRPHERAERLRDYHLEAARRCAERAPRVAAVVAALPGDGRDWGRRQTGHWTQGIGRPRVPAPTAGAAPGVPPRTAGRGSGVVTGLAGR